MKYSGVEWIGNVPDKWSIERLQWHLDEIKESNDPIKTTQVLSLTNKLGVIPYEEKGEQGNKAKENVNEYKVAYPNTIVANSMNILIGSVGKCDYFGCVSPVYYVFKPKKGENIDFLNYIFQVTQFQKELRRFANGILEIRLRVSSSDILKRYIAFPSKEEQQKIVDFLNEKTLEIDSLIEIEKKQIERLEEFKRAIIFKTVSSGMNPYVTKKESGLSWLGEIPAHWSLCPIKKIAADKKYSIVDGPFGSDMKNEEYVDSGVPIVQLNNIKAYDHNVSTSKFITEEKHKELSSHTAYAGDIVVAKMMPAGRSCILSDCYPEYTLAADAIRLETKEDVVKQFVVYCLNTYGIIACELFSKGTTRVRINLDIFKNLLIALPPYEEQKLIVNMLQEKCSNIDSLISLKQRKIESLYLYKKTLIYEYVTGKKEVMA